MATAKNVGACKYPHAYDHPVVIINGTTMEIGCAVGVVYCEDLSDWDEDAVTQRVKWLNTHTGTEVICVYEYNYQWQGDIEDDMKLVSHLGFTGYDLKDDYIDDYTDADEESEEWLEMADEMEYGNTVYGEDGKTYKGEYYETPNGLFFYVY